MSSNDRDDSHRLIRNIKPSEKLLSSLQHTETDSRPKTTSLKIHETITPLRPTPQNIETVVKDFANTGHEIRFTTSNFLRRLADCM